MKGRKLNMISRLVSAAVAAVLTIAFTSSCDNIFEDLKPCPHGVSLRFVYEYNMEYANSFPKKVDCLTLIIYDNDGNYIDTRTVTGPELQDERYRMTLNLDPGTYRFVAYGGMECPESSFSFVESTRTGEEGVALENLLVRLKEECIYTPSKKKLHHMYWGTLSLETSDNYTEGTVEMMKNTNNIRIVLQHEYGDPLDPADFEFEISDDNTVLKAIDDDIVPAGTVTYTPWATGMLQTGVIITGDDVEPYPVTVAYAELMTSRLMKKNSPTLTIRKSRDAKEEPGKEILSIPLNNYLLAMRSDHYKHMSDQEFLDRESDWTLFFFLRPNGTWLRTQIVVNDWVVRINDAEF